MRWHRVVVVGCLSVALPFASGAGQEAPIEPLDWSFSLGFDSMRGLDLSGRELGVDARLVANLTRSWQAPNSRFSRRVSLLVGSDVPYNYRSDQCVGCFSRSYAGLTVGAAYDVFRVSRFTPYLAAGTGIYFDKASRKPTATEAQYLNSGYWRPGFGLGANAGLGIKARFGSREFFVEQMIHTFDLIRLRDKGVYPLNFGIRF
jgi:hypothetical protein